jgi:UDP-GlcNAc3NAcA epimerase
MKIVTIAGTRPEFIQTSRVSHAIRRRHTDVFVNTGQHYDDLMSQIFFRELDVPRPDVNLNVGVEGATHAMQTAQTLMKLEPVLLRERPDWVVVYGDTNSTIAGALAAAKLNIPIAHIEAGLRSFDRHMPEEVNRILTDHVSDLLLAPTAVAVANLAHEGITRGVTNVGDVRVDVLAAFLPKARERQSELLTRCGLARDQRFALATIHRASNTDEPARLGAIVTAFSQFDLPVVIPVHPRLEKMLRVANITFGKSVRTVEPLGFLDMLALLDACQVVVTDSGGLQKEAYMLSRPCVTVRDSTEWTETVESGWNRMTSPADLAAAVAAAQGSLPEHHPDLYGAPGVSERVVDALER